MGLLEFEQKTRYHLLSKCKCYTVSKVTINGETFYESWFIAERPPVMIAAMVATAADAIGHCELHARARAKA